MRFLKNLCIIDVIKNHFFISKWLLFIALKSKKPISCILTVATKPYFSIKIILLTLQPKGYGTLRNLRNLRYIVACVLTTILIMFFVNGGRSNISQRNVTSKQFYAIVCIPQTTQWKSFVGYKQQRSVVFRLYSFAQHNFLPIFV